MPSPRESCCCCCLALTESGFPRSDPSSTLVAPHRSSCSTHRGMIRGSSCRMAVYDNSRHRRIASNTSSEQSTHSRSSLPRDVVIDSHYATGAMCDLPDCVSEAKRCTSVEELADNTKRSSSSEAGVITWSYKQRDSSVEIRSFSNVSSAAEQNSVLQPESKENTRRFCAHRRAILNNRLSPLFQLLLVLHRLVAVCAAGVAFSLGIKVGGFWYHSLRCFFNRVLCFRCILLI